MGAHADPRPVGSGNAPASASMCFSLHCRAVPPVFCHTRGYGIDRQITGISSPRRTATRARVLSPLLLLSSLQALGARRGSQMHGITPSDVVLGQGGSQRSPRQACAPLQAGFEDTEYPLSPTPVDPGEGRTNVWVRYIFEGGKLTRDGRLVRIVLGEDEQLALPAERVLAVRPRPPLLPRGSRAPVHDGGYRAGAGRRRHQSRRRRPCGVRRGAPGVAAARARRALRARAGRRAARRREAAAGEPRAALRGRRPGRRLLPDRHRRRQDRGAPPRPRAPVRYINDP